MNKITIKKAKIKDDIFLDVEFTEELSGHSKKDIKISCTTPIHDDLIQSFKQLHKHLTILCDEIEVPKQADFKTAEFHEFIVRAFSIGGNDENEGVTLSGYKKGRFGIVNLNTPFTKFEDADYPFISCLVEDISIAIYEVEQYLFEGKRAPEKQLELDFMEDVEINISETDFDLSK